MNIGDLLSGPAAIRSEHPALIFEGRIYSYGELDRLTNRFATVLRAAGVQPGQVIGLVLESGPELVIAALGAFKAGVVPNVVNAMLRPVEVRTVYVFIVDRAKDMINVGGEKVYPRDVEEVLFRHPAVGDAVVVAAPDPILGEVPRAVVALKPGAEVSAEELVAFLKPVLATYKLPRDIEFVSAVPRSASGKALRRLLR